MKLSDVFKIWDILQVKDTGELDYCDLDNAITEVVGIENNITLSEHIPLTSSL